MSRSARRAKAKPSPKGLPGGLDLGLGIALAVVVVAVYWPATGFDFVVMDDPIYVSENVHVQKGISGEGVAWALKEIYASTWIPLTWLSFMVDTAAFGAEPDGYHRTNVLLHALNAALLFWFLLRATGRRGPSLFVAALFALHPLRAESVAWITERKDVLSGLFFMLGLLVYERHARQPSFRKLGLVTLCMLLGLMSKPVLITFPFVLLLLDVWPLQRAGSAEGARTLQKLAIEKWPLLALSATFAIITLYAHESTGGTITGDPVPLSVRLLRVPLAYGFYLWKLVWPTQLAAIYPPVREVDVAGLSLALGALAALSVLAWKCRRTCPAVSVGWLWYLVVLLPTSGIFRVGIAHLADRFSYLPVVGLLIMIGYGAADRLGRKPAWRPALIAAAVLVVVAGAVGTRKQVAVWGDSESLFRRAIAVTERNARAHDYLGGYLGERGESEEALRLLQTAVRLEPGLATAHTNLGAVLLGRGDTVAALGHQRRAVELEPDNAVARANLGNALLISGDLEGAARSYRESIRIDPNRWQPHFNLGLVLMQSGDRRGAIPQLERALALSPGNRQILERLNQARSGSR